MLDECKGEKFFEVLAIFSNAVLKKVLSARGEEDRTSVASRLATATTLSSNQQASLLPLAIAHKAALVNILKKKDEKRRRFTEFEELLRTKTATLDKRIKQCKATPRSQKHAIPEREAASIKKQLKDNWIGDQKWLDTLLHGDAVEANDAFMTMQFDDVWSLVEGGGKLEDAAPDTGLLEDLQSRVQQQQSRLERWRVYYERLHQEEPVKTSNDQPPRNKIENVNFNDHLQLQLGSAPPVEKSAAQKTLSHPQYNDIIVVMDAELSNASKKAYARIGGSHQLHHPRKGKSVDNLRAPIHHHESTSGSHHSQFKPDVSVKATEVSEKPKKQLRDIHRKPLLRKATSTPLDSEATLVGDSAPASRNVSRPLPPAEAPPDALDNLAVPHDSNPPEVASPASEARPPSPEARPPSPEVRSASPQPEPHWPSEPPILEPPSLNVEDMLAEQIISSIGNATPSPVKRQPRPSLAERTRMSMAHGTTFEPVAEASPMESPSLPELPELTIQQAPTLDQRASLLERTRLSMAAMSQNIRPTQPAKEKRKSHSRQSLFPVNQFDTPRSRKSFEKIEETKSGDSTPKELLFSDDIDYEHVFKSRPRVAHSPISALKPSAPPNLEDAVDRLNIDDDDFDEGVTGVDLADVDADDDDVTRAWDNSPLRHAGGGVAPKGKLAIPLRYD